MAHFLTYCQRPPLSMLDSIFSLVFYFTLLTKYLLQNRARFKRQTQLDRFYILRPWAINVGCNAKFLMNVYFEKRWEQDIDDLRHELRIDPLPVIPPKLLKKKPA